jgi:Cdc6-like AAA superfamily ATPase
LYGPTGTGKTYATKRIVECFEMMSSDGEYISFSEIENEGRVKFVTFHQAYSYEEFIEGIRPQLDCPAFLTDQVSINFLSMDAKGGERSEFENALLNIYLENR